MKELIVKVIKKDIYQGMEISPKEIPFSPQIALEYCKMNSCGKYNTSWTCPPGVGDMFDLQKKYLEYDRAFVVSNVYELEDPFDLDGMNEGIKKNNVLCYKVVKEIKKTGKDFSLLKAGSCDLCENCTYPSAECRHKDLAFPTIEACGIDMMELAKRLDMVYYAGSNTVTYFTIFFYNL